MSTCGRVAAAAAIVVGIVYAIVPGFRHHFLLEDHVIEHATACLFFVAAGVGFSRLRRGTPAAYVLIPGCAFLGALDEIGFGARWLSVGLPHVRGIEIDGAHDAFAVLVDMLETRKPLYLAVYLALALSAVACFVWFFSRRDRLRALREASRRFGRSHPPLALFAVAIAMVLLALVLDLDLVEAPILIFVEELAELEAALISVFAALAIGRGPAAS